MTWIRKLFAKPLVIQDPVFGAMTFDNGIWTALPKSNLECMTIVISESSGPTGIQRELFRQIQKRADSLIDYAREFVDRQVGKIDDSINTSRLTVYAIVVGDDPESERSEFTLEFSDADAYVIHCVEFRDWSPTRYWIED